MPKDKEYYHEHKEAGLCVQCSRPADSGKVRCKKHRIHQSVRNAKYNKHNYVKKKYKDRREWRIKNGFCHICGKPLDDEIDSGRIGCVNCRMNNHKPRWGELWN